MVSHGSLSPRLSPKLPSHKIRSDKLTPRSDLHEADSPPIGACSHTGPDWTRPRPGPGTRPGPKRSPGPYGQDMRPRTGSQPRQPLEVTRFVQEFFSIHWQASCQCCPAATFGGGIIFYWNSGSKSLNLNLGSTRDEWLYSFLTTSF